MADGMVQTFAQPHPDHSGFAIANLSGSARLDDHLGRLPSEWQVVDAIRVGDLSVDHVVVGPNGVFTISVDPDPTPATIDDEGLYRAGARVTTAVKRALLAAHRLRAELAPPAFAYPILVSTISGEREHLDRLGVVPADRIVEAIWTHPGIPMRRSQRVAALWAVRSLGGRAAGQ